MISVKGLTIDVYKVAVDWLHARKCKQRLGSMLRDPRFEFGRTIQKLAEGIGADQETTRRWLVDIGAGPRRPKRSCGP
jgi:hypothetical protein